MQCIFCGDEIKKELADMEIPNCGCEEFIAISISDEQEKAILNNDP